MEALRTLRLYILLSSQCEVVAQTVFMYTYIYAFICIYTCIYLYEHLNLRPGGFCYGPILETLYLNPEPLGPCGPGPCGAPWALVGRARVSSPWALAGRALVGPLGPCDPP